MEKNNSNSEMSNVSADINSRDLALDTNSISEESIINEQFENNVEKLVNGSVAIAGAAAEISKNILESRRLKEKSNYNMAKLLSDHQKDMKVIDKKFKDQDRMLDKAEQIIDRGLEENDIEKIKAGLMGGAYIANTNPVQDIQLKINQAFHDDNDDYIEI